jgi:hypothetical protein
MLPTITFQIFEINPYFLFSGLTLIPLLIPLFQIFEINPYFLFSGLTLIPL